jgi:hypothetical protein
MALHSADSGRDMLDAWINWSTLSAKFTHGECERKWRGFTAGGSVGVGTLVKLAQDAGFDVYVRGRNAIGRPAAMKKQQAQHTGNEAAAASAEELGGDVPDGPGPAESPACATIESSRAFTVPYTLITSADYWISDRGTWSSSMNAIT